MDLKARKALSLTLRQAETEFQAGRQQRSASLFGRVLQWLPNHPLANNRIGLLHAQAGQYVQAVKHFQKAVNAEPREIQHWVHLLSALQALGDAQAARDVLAQAAQHDFPAPVLAQLTQLASTVPKQRQQALIELYQTSGKLIDTEIAARLFIDDYPDHPLGYQVLGELLHDRGELEAALNVKQQMAEHFAGDANVHNNLARTLLALQRYEEALHCARLALKISPDLRSAQIKVQLALEALEKACTPG